VLELVLQARDVCYWHMADYWSSPTECLLSRANRTHFHETY
jgi:hypothetical protein